MAIITSYWVTNNDAQVLTQFLRALGRPAFNERCIYRNVRFKDLFLEIEQGACWLMMRDGSKDRLVFKLEENEIPVNGWTVRVKKEKLRKVK